MQARFVGAALEGDEWELVGSRGCCTFTARIVGGHTLVELGRACHACLNELNSLALERGWRVLRPSPDEEPKTR